MHSYPWSNPLMFNCEVYDMATVLIVVLVLLLLGALPAWNHSRGWGYGPSGGVSLILVIALLLLFSGRV